MRKKVSFRNARPQFVRCGFERRKKRNNVVFLLLLERENWSFFRFEMKDDRERKVFEWKSVEQIVEKRETSSSKKIPCDCEQLTVAIGEHILALCLSLSHTHTHTHLHTHIHKHTCSLILQSLLHPHRLKQRHTRTLSSLSHSHTQTLAQLHKIFDDWGKLLNHQPNWKIGRMDFNNL